MEDIYQNFNHLNNELIFDNLLKAENWINLSIEQGHEITNPDEIASFISNKVKELDSFIDQINVIFVSELIKKENANEIVKELVIDGIKRDFEHQKYEVISEIKELLHLK